MKGYYMMITVKEDNMGNLHLAPVSEKHSQQLTAMHNQTKVFAQEGMRFQREILERLPKNAIKNMQGSWTATNARLLGQLSLLPRPRRRHIRAAAE